MTTPQQDSERYDVEHKNGKVVIRERGKYGRYFHLDEDAAIEVTEKLMLLLGYRDGE